MPERSLRKSTNPAWKLIPFPWHAFDSPSSPLTMDGSPARAPVPSHAVPPAPARPLAAVPRESRLSNHSNFQLLAEAALTECRPAAAAADAIVVVVEWNGERRTKEEKSYRFLLAL